MAINLNDNLKNNSPKHLDQKYAPGVGTSAIYNSLADVYAAIPLAYRAIGQTVFVKVGTENVEYWWRNGIQNSDLIVKTGSPASLTTTTTTTTQAPIATGTTRYATAQDAINIPNANEGDLLITGGNSAGEVYITFPNIYSLAPCKKILIKGGNYPLISIDSPNTGTDECPIVITNYDGQVRVKEFRIKGFQKVKLTGKYDPVNQTGDVNYQGHAAGYAWSEGKYGFYFDNQWSSIEAHVLSIAASDSTGTVIPTTDYEVEFIEAGNGGFSSVFKSNGLSGIVDNVSIHDCYFHDSHGEGIYLGNTDGGTQEMYRNYSFYNNRILRSGNDGLQSVNIVENGNIYNNVVHGALNWKSPFAENQDTGASLEFANGNISFRNNVIINGPNVLFQIFANNEATYTGVKGGTITVSNNVCLYGRGQNGVYLGTSSFLPNVSFNITGNEFGKFQFKQNEVYTTKTSRNNVIQIALDNAVSMTNNKWDASDTKSTFYSVSGGFVPTITDVNNTIGAVEDVKFVNYMGDGFDFNAYDMWASLVGATWGNEGRFPSAGTAKGQPVVYPVGYFVCHKSRIYECLVQNSQIEPGVTPGWQTYWDLKTYNGGTSYYPADDVRLSTDSIHNFLGRGLLDNPTYTGTVTTTTSTTTTSTSTSTTTVSPVNYGLVLAAYDNGGEYTLSFGRNRAQLQSSPVIVGIGSSTLAGTGAASPNKVGELLQTWLTPYTGKFINIALSGQSTLNCLPDGTSASINPHRSITAAVSVKPDIILIALPTNDIAQGLSATQFKDNIVTMFNYALYKGIPCFVVSPQPRTAFSAVQQQALADANTAMKAIIPNEYYIDVFDLLRDTTAANAAVIYPSYNSGDGVHLNDFGHGLLANAIQTKIEDFFFDLTGAYLQYEIEYGTSVDGVADPVSWSALDTITDVLTVSKNYTKAGDSWYGFRYRAQLADLSYTSWSNTAFIRQQNPRSVVDQTINIDFSIDTNGPPPVEWNNFNATSTGPTLNQSLTLFDSTTAPTGVTLTVTKLFNSAGTGGPNTGIYPIKVMQDNWRMVPQLTSAAQLKFSNLQAATAYDIEFISSYNTPDITRYLGIYVDANRFDGSPAVQSSDSGNQFDTGVLKGIVPDGSNEITLNLYSLNTSYLTAIVLKRYNNSGATTTTSTTTSTTTTTTTLVPPSSTQINVNVYNGVNPYGNSGWNDWNIGAPGTPLGFTDLLFEDGSNSGFDITWNNSYTNFMDNNINYGGTIVPPEVLRYGIYTSNSGFVVATTQFTISGLNNSHLYSFEFVGSRNNTSGNYTVYRVEGATTVESSQLLTDQNKTNSVLINDITPSSGSIVIRFARPAGGIGSFAYLNAFKIFVNTSGTPGTTTTSTTTSTTTVAPTTSTTTVAPGTTTSTTTAAPVEEYLINLYGSTSTASTDPAYNNWYVGANNVTLNSLPNIVTTSGAASSISLSFVNLSSGGYFNNGTGYGGTLHPADVTRTGVYTTNQSLTISGSDILITGLIPAATYTFEMFGSRISSTEISIYRVIGATTVDTATLAVGNNLTNAVSATVAANGSGEVTIRIRRSGATFGHINALKITAGTVTTTTTSTTTSTTTVPGTTTTTTVDPLATTTTTTSTTSTTTTSTTTTTTTTTVAPSDAATWTVVSGSSNPWYSTAPNQQGYMYTPTGYNNGNTDNYPVIIFLHGLGERGTNPATVLNTGLPQLINNGQVMNCLVFCPQLPTSNNTWLGSITNQAYNWVTTNYRVDLNRVYITGLSLGASGTWEFINTYPTKAAAVTMSSGSYSTATISLVKDIPMWFVHGDADQPQNVSNAVNAITALNSLSPKPVIPPMASVIKAGTHGDGVWNTEFYNKSTAKFDFEAWLLKHSINDDYTATKYVEELESFVTAGNYEKASIAFLTTKALVDNLPVDSSVKSNLTTRYLAAQTTFTASYFRRFIVDCGPTTGTGNVNTITSGNTGSTISNIIDTTGAASTYGFTVVSNAYYNTTDNSINTTAILNNYFGQDESVVKDGFRATYYNAGWGPYRFTGLDNGKTYNIKVYSSHSKYGGGNNTGFAETTVTINGTTKYIWSSINTRNYIEFTNITPVGGQINLYPRGGWTVSSGTPTYDSVSGSWSHPLANLTTTYTEFGIVNVIILEENNL